MNSITLWLCLLRKSQSVCHRRHLLPCSGAVETPCGKHSPVSNLQRECSAQKKTSLQTFQQSQGQSRLWPILTQGTTGKRKARGSAHCEQWEPDPQPALTVKSKAVNSGCLHGLKHSTGKYSQKSRWSVCFFPEEQSKRSHTPDIRPNSIWDVTNDFSFLRQDLTVQL